jgi:hypothetical protein
MSEPSDRQKLTKKIRNDATKHQTATESSADQPRYDVPFGPTPDEENSKFKNFAASFHKLLEHDSDGLLTDSNGGNPKSGVDNYERLLDGLKIDAPSSNFDQAALNSINLFTDPPPPGGRRRIIINPQSGKAITIKGGDNAAFRFKKKTIQNKAWESGYQVVYAEEGNTNALLKELSFKSGYSAAEMVEVYAMALLRDLNFNNYDTAVGDIQLAIDALNEFGDDFRGPKEEQPPGSGNFKVTRKTLFRGNSPESIRGDYLSKFFYPLKRPPLFASGCAPGTANLSNSQIFFDDFAVNYLVPPPRPNRAFGVTFPDYVAIQNGVIPLPDAYHSGDFTSPATIVHDGLTLGSLVHTDGLYQEYGWAADILTAGDYPRTPVSIYTKAPPGSGALSAINEGDGPTLGPPDAAGIIGAVALEAARAAWLVKYTVARRGRPEVFAALIHKRLNGGDENTYGNIDDRLLTPGTKVRQLLNRIRTQNNGIIRHPPSSGSANTYLLSQLFPEASPAHPAWTSGHATIAGACVTVIKAIFDDTAPLRRQVNIDPPPPFTDEQGVLTVGGELDKLASNVAHGRNFAGVHFRSDGEHGILLGEAVAIQFLQDHLRTYREKFRCNDNPNGTEPCFELTKRSGKRIKITVDDITNVATFALGAAEAQASADVTSDKYMV